MTTDNYYIFYFNYIIIVNIDIGNHSNELYRQTDERTRRGHESSALMYMSLILAELLDFGCRNKKIGYRKTNKTYDTYNYFIAYIILAGKSQSYDRFDG